MDLSNFSFDVATRSLIVTFTGVETILEATQVVQRLTGCADSCERRVVTINQRDPGQVVEAFERTLKTAVEKRAAQQTVGFQPTTIEGVTIPTAPSCVPDVQTAVSPEAVDEVLAETRVDEDLELEKAMAAQLPYPDAVQRQDFPAGYTVALLPCGTRVKYDTATGTEIARKVPEPTEEERCTAVVQAATEEYQEVNRIAREAQATGQYTNVQVAKVQADQQTEVVAHRPDGTREVLRPGRPGMDPALVRAAYDSHTAGGDANRLRESQSVRVLAEEGLKFFGGSKQKVQEWVQANLASIPCLQEFPPEKVQAKLTRALETAG